jgi:hypothetical protein
MSRGDRREDIFRDDEDRLDFVKFLAEAGRSRRPKNDPANLALAARLGRETTLTIKEIAARLGLGASKSASMKNPARDKKAK